MDKKTLVDDPNGLDFSCIRSPNDLCPGVSDCAVHLHTVLMPLTHSAAPSPAFVGRAKKGRSGSTLKKPWPLGRGVEGLTYRFSISFEGGRFI